MNHPKILAELEPLFNPRSVAVIGASNNRNKWGNSTFTSLMNYYKGDLFAVNNRDKKILDYPAYGKVTDIPATVDLVVIVIPPEKIPAIMEQCVMKGVKAEDGQNNLYYYFKGKVKIFLMIWVWAKEALEQILNLEIVPKDKLIGAIRNHVSIVFRDYITEPFSQ